MRRDLIETTTITFHDNGANFRLKHEYPVPAEEEETQGAISTPEIPQPVYCSPLFYPFGCIECVLGAPEDVSTHATGGGAEVSVQVTESVNITEDEVVVATDGDWLVVSLHFLHHVH